MNEAIWYLRKIPKGKVVSYKELARACGTSPRAAGRILACNKDPIQFPCYKVVSTSGILGGYSGSGGPEGKQKLLMADGIRIVDGRVDEKYFYYFSPQDIEIGS